MTQLAPHWWWKCFLPLLGDLNGSFIPNIHLFQIFTERRSVSAGFRQCLFKTAWPGRSVQQPLMTVCGTFHVVCIWKNRWKLTAVDPGLSKSQGSECCSANTEARLLATTSASPRNRGVEGDSAPQLSSLQLPPCVGILRKENNEKWGLRNQAAKENLLLRGKSGDLWVLEGDLQTGGKPSCALVLSRDKALGEVFPMIKTPNALSCLLAFSGSKADLEKGETAGKQV